jgi:hypothetical protein
VQNWRKLLSWEVIPDAPVVGDKVQFLHTPRLRRINLDWAQVSLVEDAIFLVSDIDEDGDAWAEEEYNMGVGEIWVINSTTPFTYTIPLQHWKDFIRIVS